MEISFKDRKFIYVNQCQRHGQSWSPNRFVFQVPCQLVDAAVAESMACDGVAALDGQRLSKDDVVVRSICAATTNLSTEWEEKKRRKKVRYTSLIADQPLSCCSRLTAIISENFRINHVSDWYLTHSKHSICGVWCQLCVGGEWKAEWWILLLSESLFAAWTDT